MKTPKRLWALLLALLCLSGCGGNGGGKSLTGQAETEPREVPPLTEEDAAALTEASLKLLKESWTGENILLSPLSVLSALGMTANGAGGETLEQMEAALGLPAERLNAALAVWAAGLPKEKDCRADLANSVWVRDDGSFEANQDFLQTAADWYGAEVFASRFDDATVEDINRWVRENTHEMIPEIIDGLDETTVMCLVNALALEAEWEEIYREDRVWEDQVFTAGDGAEQSAEMMYSSEWSYLGDDSAQGFMKPYQGGRWVFAALLPEEGVELGDYLSSLTGEGLRALLSGAEEREVLAGIPKFRCEYGTELSDCLRAMGMTDAFDELRADLSGLGTSSWGPLYISRVLHKTYIAVDEKGTQAGAAAAVMADGPGADPGFDPPVVYLDRPFLYMLADTETNLPALIGAVTSME